MINATPLNVAVARAALVAELLPDSLSEREQDGICCLLSQWVQAAGMAGEDAARVAIVNLAVAMMRARGGCQGDPAAAELVAYLLGILFPEDAPMVGHWRDSDGYTWDEASLTIPESFRTTLDDLRVAVDARGF